MSIKPRSSRAKSTSRHRRWRKLSEAIQCQERTWSQLRLKEVCTESVFFFFFFFEGRTNIWAELNNRVAFIDFVRGLLNINPLERWTPQQAKLHPFITQHKFTGPFVPPMNLKYAAPGKGIAPGVLQQQQAEATSKQRAAQAVQAQSAAQAAYSISMNPFHSPSHSQPPIYNGMFPGQQAAAPAYSAQPPGYAHQMGMMQGQMPHSQYAPPPSLYAQATTRAGRQRSSTMEQGVHPSIQRVASHLDPNAPIRLQPSPAYYPPPPDGYADPNTGQRRRASRAGGNQRNRDFIRTLEDGVLGEASNQWHWTFKFGRKWSFIFKCP